MIRAESVCKDYHSETGHRWNRVLSDISFAISPGEIIAVGDQRFQRRSYEELFEKRADRSLILASHSPDTVRAYCSRALVLHHGRGKVFDDLDLAIAIYSDL